MDRALILVTLGLASTFFVVREGSRMTRERLYEIIIAIYTFACCFTRLYVPLFKGSGEPCGTFGTGLGIWPFYGLSLVLIWIVAHDKSWRIRQPNIWLLIVFTAYAGFTLVNPYNMSRTATIVEVFYLLSFAVFMYLFANSFNVKNVVNGIFMGLAATAILHFLLAILYPVLGMEAAMKLFDDEAANRNDDRMGAVGTMGHPNVLGTYASYYFNFFIACFVTAYKRRTSGMLAVLSFLVIILSASRSALMASVVSLVLIVVCYVYRRYKLLSLQSVLKGIIPLGIFIALLLYGPLSFLFSDVDNLDEMTTSRLMHYYCGYEIFQDHPLVGVGMNSHLIYLGENSSAVIFEQVFDMTDLWQPEEFMFNNPIHNIWIIMITELGLIGFLPILGFVLWYMATFKRRTRLSLNRYYNIVNISGFGVICCWLIQGNSDWAPLTPQVLSLSLMFVALSLNRHYAAEVHPEFESVEASRSHVEQVATQSSEEQPSEVQPA